MPTLGLTRLVPARLQSRAGTLAAPVLAAMAALAACALVTVVDPNEPGHYPTCPFHALTGLWCPGCGSLRAIHAIGHGHLREALGFNILTVAALPLLGVLWAAWARRSWHGSPRSRAANPRWLWGLLVLVLVFWVVRNLPVGEALAP
jgi:Protein of unknown function (DUF2752)